MSDEISSANEDRPWDQVVAKVVRFEPPVLSDDVGPHGERYYERNPMVVLEGDYVPQYAERLDGDDAGRYRLEVADEDVQASIERATITPGSVVSVDVFQGWVERIGPLERPEPPVDELGERPDEPHAAELWDMDARLILHQRAPWAFDVDRRIWGVFTGVQARDEAPGDAPVDVHIETRFDPPPGARPLPGVPDGYAIPAPPEFEEIIDARFITPGTPVVMTIVGDRWPGSGPSAHLMNINTECEPLVLAVALGPRPLDDRKALKLWDEVTASVVAYREQWGIRDTTSLLGERPQTDEQAVQRAAVERTVAHGRRLLEREQLTRDVPTIDLGR